MGILLFSFAGPGGAAELKLGAYFGDGMVLQRGNGIWIWGEGTPNADIVVSLGKQQANATVDSHGQWQVRLGSVPAGGPYRLAVNSGKESVFIRDVLVGDVWLCSGQSNMQMPVKECEASEQQATLAVRPILRLCSVGKSSSAQPKSSADIHWRTCTPESARDFSAVGYFFACELLKDPALTNVPVGLIDSSFGGTTCEGWIPQQSLRKFSPQDLHDSIFGIKPANLYNAMIAPLGKAAFRGVIWYQGESNSQHPDSYPRLLSTMIAEWRSQFEEPDLPFFIVQLPDYARQWDGFYWPWEREAQAETVRLVPHTALVLGINTTDGFNLHPKQKLEIGRRIALQVRHDVYKEDIIAQGPVFKSARVEGATMRVTFDTDGDGLACRSPQGIRGFALAGDDGDYRFADARIDGNSVILQCPEVPHPKTVRYAWAAVPRSTLTGESGLPAAPFRTDDFPPFNVEVQREPISHRITTSAYDITVDGNGMVSSLIVHGEQFISNEPGMNGGSSIPAIWGPQSLGTIRSLGPNVLSCSDEQVSLQMIFEEKSMRWFIANQGKDAIQFRLALSPFVKITGANSNVTVSRGKASLEIDGMDSITKVANEQVLTIGVKGGATGTLFLNTAQISASTSTH